MFSNTTDREDTAKRGAWFWRRIAFPLLMALLTLAFVGMSTVGALAAPDRSATVSRQQADSSPALVSYNGMLYIGWTGRNAAHNLNLMSYNPSTRVFSPARVLTDTTLWSSGPSLANFNDNLYVAWQGRDNHLNIGRYNPDNPTVLAHKVTLSDTSTNAPSLTAFNGRLYLSWRGMDGRLNIISSADASTFNTKVTYNIPIRTTPSLVAANVYLYMFWEDMSASSHIVVGRYDPAHPAVLGSIVTLASTSRLPVGVSHAGVPAPYVIVAWRTATDPHVRLAVFEGGQFLHNPVYTAETTPFGPAISEPFVSWTGTDSAQSINVSQFNI